jgi:hypothetical protein
LIREALINWLRDGRFTSIRDVRLLGTNVARRVELTRSRLLSGTVAPGATYAFSLRPLSGASLEGSRQGEILLATQFV